MPIYDLFNKLFTIDYPHLLSRNQFADIALLLVAGKSWLPM